MYLNRYNNLRNSLKQIVVSIIYFVAAFMFLYIFPSIGTADEEDAICARVRIQLSQDVVIARNAFKATLEITNAPENVPLENLTVILNISDENDQPANNLFGIHPPELSGVGDVNGTGIIQPGTTAIASWLIVPTRDAAPDGSVMYNVGGEFSYTQGGSTITMPLFPAPILVKPDPLLVLDYYWEKDVYGDDPFTPEIEPSIPFALGLRVSNNGNGVADDFRIIGSQPQIVENEKGLLVNFKIIGTQVNADTLTPIIGADLGDIDPGTTSVAVWMMTSSLQGQFIDYDATFTHIDGLGNPRLSLIDTVNIHELIHVVRVDSPDDDGKPDFLAKDGEIYNVYDSTNVDAVVTDQSASSMLSFDEQNGTQVKYTLETPPALGFIHIKLEDPFNGKKVITEVIRSDSKAIMAENTWLSKERQPDMTWVYFINLFDIDSTGSYSMTMENGPSFVDSDNDGMDDQWELDHFGSLDNDGTGDADGDGISDLDEYFNGTDPGNNSAPGVPQILSPADQTEDTSLQPTLAIVNSIDPDGDAVTYDFEVFADAAMTQLVASDLDYAETPTNTAWTVPDALSDNAWYYWRVRAGDGKGFSAWVYASFFVNTANDAPGPLQISSPADNAEVDTLTPMLEVTNSTDVDNDSLTYSFGVYTDFNLTDLVTSASDLDPGSGGTTAWTVAPALSDNSFYYWQAVVTDEHGAETTSDVASFFVNTFNDAPTEPAIVSPAVDSEVTSQDQILTIANATDADNDPLSYRFQIDVVDTFDSPSLLISDLIAEGASETGWPVTALSDNTMYYWRARANDGAAESNWAQGRFFVNTANDAPGIPEIRNPGDGSWVDTLAPELAVLPATDADNDLLTYTYQVFTDNELTSLLVEHEGGEAWLVDPQLADNNWYYWRARAVDEHDLAGDWSDAYSFFIDDNGVNDTPQISFVQPAANVTTAAVQLQIQWEDSDPDSSAVISLYYDTDTSGQDGTLIVSEIAEDDDNDTYLWNLAALADSTYFLYAVITDEVHTTTTYATVSVTIDRTAPQVTAAPAGGTYVEAQSVELSTDEAATIYFTLDSSIPTSASTPYTTAITIDQTTTLRAIAVDAAGNESEILTEVYTIETSANTPPVADAGSDVTVSLGDSAEPDGSSSYDPDNGPESLSFTWTVLSVPPGSGITDNDLNGADTALCTFTPDTAGEYVLSLTVSDGQDQATDEVTVTCQADGVPGDLDGDGDIDSSDYMVFRSTLGKCAGDAGFIAAADYDGDGCVTYTDYSIWYGYFRNQ